MNHVILLGAGFSYDAGMPLAKELTDVLLGMFNESNIKRFGRQLSLHEPYGADRPINFDAISSGLDLLLAFKKSGTSNYEELLSKLEERTKGGILSNSDSYNYLLSKLYKIIHEILSVYQLSAYSIMYTKAFKWYTRLIYLLNENQETWVITLNHDLFLECIAIDLKIPISYGQSSKMTFPISNLEMDKKITFLCHERDSYSKESKGFIFGQKGINLIKLHGGLGEFEYKDGSIICNLDVTKSNSQEFINEFTKSRNLAFYRSGFPLDGGRDSIVTNGDGELDILTKAMLTGGSKYSTTIEIKKKEEKLNLVDRVLKTAKKITIIGYGFGDKHVNFKISNAMVMNNEMKLIIVDPCHNKLPEFLEQFDYKERIVKATCRTTEWMNYYKYKKWDNEEREALRTNDSDRERVLSYVKQFFH